MAGQLGGRGDAVVGEGGGDGVAVGVVDDLLEQRLGDALHDPALLLAGDDHRVDHRPAVVDGDEAHAAAPAPVSTSTSTTAAWQPEGNVGPGCSKSTSAPSGADRADLGPGEASGRACRRRRSGRRPSSTTSAGAASSRSAAASRACARMPVPGGGDGARRPASASGPSRCPPRAARARVAVVQAHRGDRQAQPLVQQQPPRGGVGLALVVGAVAHDEAHVVAVDLDLTDAHSPGRFIGVQSSHMAIADAPHDPLARRPAAAPARRAPSS